MFNILDTECGAATDSSKEIRELMIDLKEFGVPICLDTVIMMTDYLEKVDKEISEVDSQIVAQYIDQNTEIEIKTKNVVGKEEFLNVHGVDTSYMSETTIQTTFDDLFFSKVSEGDKNE